MGKLKFEFLLSISTQFEFYQQYQCITPVLQAILDFFADIISFQHVKISITCHVIEIFTELSCSSSSTSSASSASSSSSS